MDSDPPSEHHRQRQGLILLLLLLGPAPISLILFAVGTSPIAVGIVLCGTAALIATMLELYRRQRRDAPSCGLPVLPGLQVAAFLLILAGIAAGTFFVPHPDLVGVGLVFLGLVMAIIYVFGARIRRSLEEPDERGAVLVLSLMACLIALANACQ